MVNPFNEGKTQADLERDFRTGWARLKRWAASVPWASIAAVGVAVWFLRDWLLPVVLAGVAVWLAWSYRDSPVVLWLRRAIWDRLFSRPAAPTSSVRPLFATAATVGAGSILTGVGRGILANWKIFAMVASLAVVGVLIAQVQVTAANLRTARAETAKAAQRAAGWEAYARAGDQEARLRIEAHKAFALRVAQERQETVAYVRSVERRAARLEADIRRIKLETARTFGGGDVAEQLRVLEEPTNGADTAPSL